MTQICQIQNEMQMTGSRLTAASLIGDWPSSADGVNYQSSVFRVWVKLVNFLVKKYYQYNIGNNSSKIKLSVE